MKSWTEGRILFLGIALAIAVTVCCFLLNLGGAWYGGAADLSELAVTLLYVIFWVVFSIVSPKHTPFVKIVFVISLLSFISSICSLIFRLTHSGFILATLISVFASVPFYGLRFFMGWTGLYAFASIASAVWLTYTSRNLRNVRKK